jgi:hypothetical protein
MTDMVACGLLDEYRSSGGSNPSEGEDGGTSKGDGVLPGLWHSYQRKFLPVMDCQICGRLICKVEATHLSCRVRYAATTPNVQLLAPKTVATIFPVST